MSLRPDIEIQLDEQLHDIAKCLKGPEEIKQFIGKYGDKALALLDYHGVSALIYEHQSQQELTCETSLQAFEKIRLTVPVIVASESLKRNEIEKLIDSLTKANLTDFVIFKGWALAYSVYKKPWLRPRTDIDILIEHSQRNAYHNFLVSSGFTRELAIEGDLIAYQSGYSKTLSKHSKIYIDLHWKVSNRQCLALAFSTTDIIQNAQTVQNGTINFKIPSNVDGILLACQHRLGHHHSEERLIWLYDIHLLAESLDPMQWSDFLHKAKQLRIANLSFNALNRAQRLFATDIPSDTIEKLSVLCQRDEPSAIFLDRALSNRKILLSDISSITSLTAKLRFVIETAFPSKDYIQEKMATRSATWGYVKRAYLGLRKVLFNN